VDEVTTVCLVKNGDKVAIYDKAIFTFQAPCPDLTVTYKSRCLVLNELTMRDDLFLELFLVRFLIALSSTKAIMKLNELPVDISLDDLLALRS
jgi:hypothetical protein